MNDQGERLEASIRAGKARVNLSRATILLIDDALGLEILTQVFVGFGARSLHRARVRQEAEEIARNSQLDLIITDAQIDGVDQTDFVRGLRQSAFGATNRFTPVIVLSAHTGSKRVGDSRDCGANFFVAKPISPQVLMDRLIWISREQRPYLKAGNYAGPDRRFRNEELPEGEPGRRHDDPKPS